MSCGQQERRADTNEEADIKARLPLSAIIIALLLLVGALAAACGDETVGVPDPTPTSSGTPIPPAIDGYLEDIESIFDDTTGEIGKIEAEFEEDFATADDEDDADEALEDAIRDYQRVIDRASRDLSSLRPAVEATSQHDALSAALDRAVTNVDALWEEYRATRSGDDDRDVSPAQAALAAQAAEAFALISTELEDACLELQDLAAEHEVEADLICGEEAPAPTGSPAPTNAPA
ncbi:MAG: hypothetical protein IIB87_06895 [Chloroflexi bacterium]|nr:hypothetical protein [Chloroflexota bacterium]